jgi:hypothetical protein
MALLAIIWIFLPVRFMVRSICCPKFAYVGMTRIHGDFVLPLITQGQDGILPRQSNLDFSISHSELRVEKRDSKYVQ